MQKFFKNSLGLSKKNYNNSMEFLELFDKFKPLSNNGFDSVLSFVHCNLAKKKHIKKIKKLQASIVHCPKSNKLLGNPLLELSKIYQISKKNISKTNTPKQGTKQKINISIATDGLSSNNSSNIIDELKSAIFMHITNTYKNIYKFANALMLYGTKNGAIVLGLKKGIIKKNYDSDLIIFNLNTTPIKKHIALDVILNISKNNIQKMYLKGKLVF